MTEHKWSAGGSGSGFVVAPFSVLTSELNGLGDNNTALSSANGATGVFDQSDTSAYVWGILTFVAGGNFTPAAPAYLAGWFVAKSDNANFERTVTNTMLPRAYDFTIGLHTSAYSSGQTASSGSRPVMVPSTPFKVLLHSRANTALPGSNNILKLGLVASAMV